MKYQSPQGNKQNLCKHYGETPSTEMNYKCTSDADYYGRPAGINPSGIINRTLDLIVNNKWLKMRNVFSTESIASAPTFEEGKFIRKSGACYLHVTNKIMWLVTRTIYSCFGRIESTVFAISSLWMSHAFKTTLKEWVVSGGSTEKTWKPFFQTRKKLQKRIKLLHLNITTTFEGSHKNWRARWNFHHRSTEYWF